MQSDEVRALVDLSNSFEMQSDEESKCLNLLQNAFAPSMRGFTYLNQVSSHLPYILDRCSGRIQITDTREIIWQPDEKDSTAAHYIKPEILAKHSIVTLVNDKAKNQVSVNKLSNCGRFQTLIVDCLNDPGQDFPKQQGIILRSDTPELADAKNQRTSGLAYIANSMFRYVPGTQQVASISNYVNEGYDVTEFCKTQDSFLLLDQGVDKGEGEGLYDDDLYDKNGWHRHMHARRILFWMDGHPAPTKDQGEHEVTLTRLTLALDPVKALKAFEEDPWVSNYL